MAGFFAVVRRNAAAYVSQFIFRIFSLPVTYLYHAVFICMCLRCTRKSGFQWYRSFIVGLVMTAGPRYAFSKLCDIPLSDLEGWTHASWAFFAVAWAAFNIFPFDLVFKCARAGPMRAVLQCLDGLSQAQVMVQLCYGGVGLFRGEPLRVITIAAFCMCAPLIGDVVDRMVIGERNCPMAYQFHYIKRVILTVSAVTLIAERSALDVVVGCQVYAVVSTVYVLLAIVDTALTGEAFNTVDFLFPNFLSVATYWPQATK